MITLLGRNVSGKFGGIRLLEKDGTGAALFTLGKLILFMAMFVMIYAGNKRGWSWYKLSEPLDKKSYLGRWKWLLVAAIVLNALENKWMNLNDDGGFDNIGTFEYIITYAALIVLAEVPVYTAMLATLVKRAEVLKFRQVFYTISIIFMPIGLIYFPHIYWLLCISLYWGKEDISAAKLPSADGDIAAGGDS